MVYMHIIMYFMNLLFSLIFAPAALVILVCLHDQKEKQDIIHLERN